MKISSFWGECYTLKHPQSRAITGLIIWWSQSSETWTSPTKITWDRLSDPWKCLGSSPIQWCHVHCVRHHDRSFTNLRKITLEDIQCNRYVDYQDGWMERTKFDSVSVPMIDTNKNNTLNAQWNQMIFSTVSS
jgi:hypothetical protein